MRHGQPRSPCCPSLEPSRTSATPRRSLPTRPPRTWASATRTGRRRRSAPSPATPATPVLDDVRGGLVVTARYDPPDPTTVASRRASLIGYSVTPLRLDSALDSLRRSAGAVAVFGPSHRVAAGQGFENGASDGVGRYEVPLDGGALPSGWRMQVSVRQQPAAHQCLAGGAPGAVRRPAGCWRRRPAARPSSGGSETTRAGGEQTDATLAELASIAQSSLDLAEVLPASCALLESALELDGLALLDSGSRPTFVWRNAPDEREPAQRPARSGPGRQPVSRYRSPAADDRWECCGCVRGASWTRWTCARSSRPPRPCRPRSPTPTPTRTSGR